MKIELLKKRKLEIGLSLFIGMSVSVSYTHLRAHET